MIDRPVSPVPISACDLPPRASLLPIFDLQGMSTRPHRAPERTHTCPTDFALQGTADIKQLQNHHESKHPKLPFTQVRAYSSCS